MTRAGWTWVVLLAGLSLGVGAVAWVSVAAVRVAGQARQTAAVEENVRVALWRMESTLVPLVAREAGRPAADYSPMFAPRRAYSAAREAYPPGTVLLPSPLGEERAADVRLHFEVDANQRWLSPQVAARSTEATFAARDTPGATAADLRHLSQILPLADLLAAAASLHPTTAPPAEDVPAPTAQQEEGAPPVAVQTAQIGQGVRNVLEQQRRAQTFRSVQRATIVENPAEDDVVVGAMKATWIAGELLLVRQVRDRDGERIQGCWLDWPAIEARLREQIADLFPRAQLGPASSAQPDPSRTLATLPIRLTPGPTALAVVGSDASLTLSLVVAWAALALSALALIVLLVGAQRLSERRAAFVSAVTHELRTPLTTFRLYTDLLGSDSAQDSGKRRAYADTLGREARRLGHLIENVLTYSRLERGRSAATLEAIRLDVLLEPMRPVLERRLAQDGLALVLHAPPESAHVVVRTDPAAVERILANLADNACKYAASGEPPILRIDVEPASRHVFLRIRDYGPGIEKRFRRKLFRAYGRPAGATSPGVGLGLALCRRLARHIGGELRLDSRVQDGAAIVLRLPRD